MKRLLTLLAAAALLITPVFAAPGAIPRPEPTPCAHSFEISVTKEADCVHQGLLTYTCVKCGLVYTVRALPSGEHDYVLTETTAACTEDGKAIYTCSVCGDTYTEPVKASGHVPEEEPASCDRNRLCAVCGEILERATGHEYAYQYDAELDDEGGFITFGTWQCTVCGDTLAATEGNALYYYSLLDEAEASDSDLNEASDTDLEPTPAAAYTEDSPTDADEPEETPEPEPEEPEEPEEPAEADRPEEPAEPEDPETAEEDAAPNPRTKLWAIVSAAAVVILAAEAVVLTRSSDKKKVNQ